MVSKNTIAALVAGMGLATGVRAGARGAPGRGRAGGGRWTWCSGTSPQPGSTATGTATAPRSPRVGASCTFRCGGPRTVRDHQILSILADRIRRVLSTSATIWEYWYATRVRTTRSG